MEYDRKQRSNDGDRYQIELGEARLLYSTWQATKQSVLTKERIEYLEKRLGYGSSQRIRQLMHKLRTGELE